MYPPGDKSIRRYVLPKLSGGLCLSQAQDNECSQFDNIEMIRDMWVRTRAPSALLAPDGTFGPSGVVGIGYLGLGGFKTDTNDVIVATVNGLFYYASTSQAPTPPINIWNTFTGPDSPVGSLVIFAGFTDTSFNATILMCNNLSAWDNIYSWDGVSGNAVLLRNSPDDVYTMVTYNNRIYAVAAAEENVVQFSDVSNATSWPSSNKFSVGPQYGPIVCLVVQDYVLYIFTKNAILYLQGDPAGSFAITPLHPGIGAIDQGTICQFGTATAFRFANNTYVLSGNANLISDPIRGLPTNSTSGAELTPYKYFLMQSQEVVDGEGLYLYVCDRERTGAWSRYYYPPTTGLGSTTLIRPILKYIGEWDALLIAGGDGNVYYQQFQDNFFMTGGAYSDYGPSGLVPITTTIKTRPLDLGDRALTKQWRRGMLYGDGSNITVTMDITTSTGTTSSIPATLSSTTLPCEFNLPVLDGGASDYPAEFVEITLTITGQSMLLRDVVLEYQAKRYQFFDNV